MLALDNADKLRGDASAATVVDYTLHGIVGTVITQLADGQLASSIGDLYTAASAGIAVTSIVLVNTDSSARTVNLYLTPSGGTARRLIPKDMSLGVGYALVFDGQKTCVLDTSGQILSTWAVDDTPVDGETSQPISSNWAFDHNARDATAAVQGHATAAHITAIEANTAKVTNATHSGEVTGATALTIANDAVTYAKMQNVSATDKVLGRVTAGAGDVEEIACTAAGRALLDDATASDQRTTLGLAIGTNVLAQQAIGIADNYLLEVDDATAADDDFARFTAAGIEGIPVATAITALLAAALPENTAIILDAALSADGKYSGIVEAGTAGAILAFGDLVYFAVADSKWELTDANAAATAFGKIGICVLAAAENAATVILLFGKVRADAAFPALTIGAPVHIGEVAGDIVVAAPVTASAIVRIIGYGNTADELFFCPDNTYLELA